MGSRKMNSFCIAAFSALLTFAMFTSGCEEMDEYGDEYGDYEDEFEVEEATQALTPTTSDYDFVVPRGGGYCVCKHNGRRYSQGETAHIWDHTCGAYRFYICQSCRWRPFGNCFDMSANQTYNR